MFQGTGVCELLSSTGANPVAEWAACAAAGAKHAARPPKRVYAKELKGYAYQLAAGRLQFPKPELERKGAYLIHPILNLQVLLQSASAFAVDLTLSDMHGTRRKLLLNKNVRDLKVTPLHASVPMQLPESCWQNTSIDIGALFKRAWPSETFRAIEVISLSGACLLRRVDSFKHLPAYLPRNMAFPQELDHASVFVGDDEFASSQPMVRAPSFVSEGTSRNASKEFAPSGRLNVRAQRPPAPTGPKLSAAVAPPSPPPSSTRLPAIAGAPQAARLQQRRSKDDILAMLNTGESQANRRVAAPVAARGPSPSRIPLPTARLSPLHATGQAHDARVSVPHALSEVQDAMDLIRRSLRDAEWGAPPSAAAPAVRVDDAQRSVVTIDTAKATERSSSSSHEDGKAPEPKQSLSRAPSSSLMRSTASSRARSRQTTANSFDDLAARSNESLSRLLLLRPGSSSSAAEASRPLVQVETVAAEEDAPTTTQSVGHSPSSAPSRDSLRASRDTHSQSSLRPTSSSAAPAPTMTAIVERVKSQVWDVLAEMETESPGTLSPERAQSRGGGEQKADASSVGGSSGSDSIPSSKRSSSTTSPAYVTGSKDATQEAPSSSPNDDDDEMEVVWDPAVGAYFSKETGQHYQLAEGVS